MCNIQQITVAWEFEYEEPFGKDIIRLVSLFVVIFNFIENLLINTVPFLYHYNCANFVSCTNKLYDMKFLCTLLSLAILSLFFSCNKKIDNPKLIESLQVHIDSVVKQGYQIDKIAISSKSFADHGKDDLGYLEHMFIYAVAPDSTIKYLANFSLSGGSVDNELIFHGYPTNSYNKKKEIRYSFKPNMVDALAKLEDVKKLIPDNYKYEHLLKLSYLVTKDAQPVYEFKMGLKPNSKDVLHPNVKQEDVTHVTVTNSTRRRKFGMTETTHSTNVDKTTQHTITFWLRGGQIEII